MNAETGSDVRLAEMAMARNRERTEAARVQAETAGSLHRVPTQAELAEKAAMALEDSGACRDAFTRALDLTRGPRPVDQGGVLRGRK